MTIATKSHGTLLKMGSGGSATSPKTITGSAVGDPFTVIEATAHGFKTGDFVTIAGVTGTGAAVPLNKTHRVALTLDANHFAVEAVTTATGSGGTATGIAETFATLAEVGDIKGPELTRDDIDATTHDSPDDFEELLSGLKKSGNVTFKVNWNPSNPTHAGTGSLWAHYGTGDSVNFEVESPRGDVMAFAANVNGIGPDFPVNGLIAADITLKVTGEVILTVATS